MSVYLITWDLNKEGIAYQNVSARLHARLDTLETIKHKDLDSVRFVSTSDSAEKLYNYIASGILDANDKIIVSRMRGGENWGVISQEVWSWISARI
jgi:hypothetical protein